MKSLAFSPEERRVLIRTAAEQGCTYDALVGLLQSKANALYRAGEQLQFREKAWQEVVHGALVGAEVSQNNVVWFPPDSPFGSR